MADLITITCKNQACRYHAELRSGLNSGRFRRLRAFEKQLPEGTIPPGASLTTGGVYLCPQCRSFMDSDAFFLLENLRYTPFGTLRFDVSFPFGEPLCPACGSGLTYIRNVLSSTVKCPRCGGDLKARIAGSSD